jgi:hypothetical protein
LQEFENFSPSLTVYIFPFVILAKNREQFKSNSEIHGINTRYTNNFHCLSSNLTTFQKGSYYFGIKVFNSLPPSMKILVHDTKEFRSALKRFLILNSFYSLEEYFNYKKN